MADIEAGPGEAGLPPVLARLARLRKRLPALRLGSYAEVQVAPRQLAFLREWRGQWALVALNSDSKAVDLDLAIPFPAARLRDELEAEARPGGETFEVKDGRLRLRLNPCWARVLVPA
jgi:hypothetical protein